MEGHIVMDDLHGLLAASSAAFFTYFMLVFLRAFQQLNVMKSKYLLILPFSMGMAFCDVNLVRIIVQSSTIWICIPIGIGGSTGCVLAMFIHGRIK